MPNPDVQSRETPDEIIHIAGPVITFGTLIRQRCSWCGALITEVDLTRIGTPEASRPDDLRGKPLDPDRELSWWHGLVAVSGTNPRSYAAVDDPADGKAPDRSCMVLMPEEMSVT